jgi:hypothetical protein
VAGYLSWYYDNDRFNEVHKPQKYVTLDVCLDPKHKDLTKLCLWELGEEKSMGQMLTRRIRDRNEDHILKAEQMAAATHPADIPEDNNPRDDTHDMMVEEALQNGPSLQKIVLGDKTFLQAIRMDTLRIVYFPRL